MKGNILQGTARGRMGEIVAKVVHGQQIYGKYQKNVHNPKSPKQVDTRNTFSSVSKIMAEIREKLSNFGIKPTYATYSGASKSLSNAVYPFCFLHSKIYDAEGNNFSLDVQKPLLTDGITGNNLPFLFEQISNNLIWADVFGFVGISYFGSDKPIFGKDLFSVVLTSQSDKAMPNVQILRNDYALRLEDRTNNIGEPRGYGLKDTIGACGDWDFIYRITTSVDPLGVAEPIEFNGAFNQIGALAILFDEKNQVIACGNPYKQIAKIP